RPAPASSVLARRPRAAVRRAVSRRPPPPLCPRPPPRPRRHPWLRRPSRPVPSALPSSSHARGSGPRARCRCPPTRCAERSMTSRPATPLTAGPWLGPRSRSRPRTRRSSRRSTRPSPPPRTSTSMRSSRADGPEPVTARDLAALDDLLLREGWHERPVAVLDLDAVDHNAADIVRRAGGTPVRIASKSLRVRALLERVLARPGFQGVLAYTLPEALWLVVHGARDVLVAYPSAERGAVRRLATRPEALAAIPLMVD